MTIGERIRAIREQKDMSLEDVAKICGTSRQAIYKYENNIVTNIPYDRIILLSQALGVSPSALMGWEEAPVVSADGLSQRQRSIVDKIMLMSDDELDRFEKILDLVDRKG